MPNNRVRTPLSQSDKWFCVGVLSALAQVKVAGETTLFDEIVSACGRKELLKTARLTGNMKWSGMSEYLRRNSEVPR